MYKRQVIIFLTDVRTGLTASDQEVANMLLRSGKPIVLAVNKMDSTEMCIRDSQYAKAHKDDPDSWSQDDALPEQKRPATPAEQVGPEADQKGRDEE